MRCEACDIDYPPDVYEQHNCPMLRREVTAMGIVKHGSGEILPEPSDNQKTAQANWTERDDAALAEENARADSDEKKD